MNVVLTCIFVLILAYSFQQILKYSQRQNLKTWHGYYLFCPININLIIIVTKLCNSLVKYEVSRNSVHQFLKFSFQKMYGRQADIDPNRLAAEQYYLTNSQTVFSIHKNQLVCIRILGYNPTKTQKFYLKLTRNYTRTRLKKFLNRT